MSLTRVCASVALAGTPGGLQGWAMTEIEHIRPDGMANAPTYTHVVTSRSERIVHISGQVAIDADG